MKITKEAKLTLETGDILTGDEYFNVWFNKDADSYSFAYLSFKSIMYQYQTENWNNNGEFFSMMNLENPEYKVTGFDKKLFNNTRSIEVCKEENLVKIELNNGDSVILYPHDKVISINKDSVLDLNSISLNSYEEIQEHGMLTIKVPLEPKVLDIKDLLDNYARLSIASKISAYNIEEGSKIVSCTIDNNDNPVISTLTVTKVSKVSGVIFEFSEVPQNEHNYAIVNDILVCTDGR